uniref:RING-type domain-containing protein n=1 Tax=Caenorhabditis japonica TaxID=281687 RepID=A0A8R1DZJ8_CAEJA
MVYRRGETQIDKVSQFEEWTGQRGRAAGNPFSGRVTDVFGRPVHGGKLTYKDSKIFTCSLKRNVKEPGSGLCSKCYTQTRFLRICVTCEFSKKQFQRCVFINQDDESQQCFLMSEHNIMQLPSRLLCASCFSDNPEHERHQQIKLKDIKGSADQIKLFISRIPGQFLWNEIKSTEDESGVVKCKLRYMRMLRTCEVLTHFAEIHMKLPIPKMLQSANRHFITHFRMFSKISKYFEGLEWEDFLQPHPELVNSLIESLTFQWNQYKSLSGLCECSKFWQDISENHCWKNDLELNYVEMIMNTSLEENDEEHGRCPFDFQTSSIQRKVLETLKAREFPKWKTHLLPSVFCWNRFYVRQCGLFDSESHQPCICRKCGTSTCLDCIKSNWMLHCPICGMNLEGVANRDSKIEELVEFYKTNCVEVYDEWWRGEFIPNGEGFCLNCSSYSTQLEVCLYCELAERKQSILTASRKSRGENSPHFNYRHVPLNRFPVRWQCIGCENRLDARSEHRYCQKIPDSGKMYFSGRGCSHSRKRLYNECRGYDQTADLCEFNVVKLKLIGKSEFLMRYCTMEIANQILEAGLVGLTENIGVCYCPLRMSRLMSTQKLLESYTKGYFANVFKENTNEYLAQKIKVLIDNLKSQWSEFKQLHEPCRCFLIFENVKKNEDRDEEMHLISKYQLNRAHTGCPLDYYPYPRDDKDFEGSFALLYSQKTSPHF